MKEYYLFLNGLFKGEILGGTERAFHVRDLIFHDIIPLDSISQPRFPGQMDVAFFVQRVTGGMNPDEGSFPWNFLKED